MLVASLKVIIGLIVLIASADRLVTGAAACARYFGVTPLFIGLTIIAFGTSAPEIMVAIMASLSNNSGIAIGNAIGSNIANIGLVISLCAIIKPIKVTNKIIRKEFPVLIGITLITSVILKYLSLNIISGILLLVILLIYLYWLWHRSKIDYASSQEFYAEVEEQLSTTISLRSAILWLVFGLIFISISADIVISGAVTLARHLNVSDAVIGLTLIAFGTSLPELVTSLVGIMKGEHGIAMGNIVGSNIFNLTAVIAPCALIAPNAPIDADLLSRDLLLMIVITLIFVIAVMVHRGQKKYLSRLGGGILGIFYISYISYLVVKSL